MDAVKVNSGSFMGKSGGAYLVTPSGNPSRGVRKVIPDVASIEHAFAVAAVTLLPDELSARQLVRRLMPSLYTFRKKGFSFVQITNVLNIAIGKTSLQVATIRAYYNEFILEKQDECETLLRSAMAMTEQVKKMEGNKPSRGMLHDAVKMKSVIDEAATAKEAANRLIDGYRTRSAPPVDDMDMQPVAVATPVSVHNEIPASPSMPIIDELQTAPLASDGTFDSPDIHEIPVHEIPVTSMEATVPQFEKMSPSATEVKGQTESLQCLTEPTPDMIHPANSDTFDGVAPAFFSDAILEHPSIEGLLLTKEQRMCNKRLKYSVQGTDDPLVESVQQMMMRIKWRKSTKAFASRSEGDFVEMNSNVFKKRIDSSVCVASERQR